MYTHTHTHTSLTQSKGGQTLERELGEDRFGGRETTKGGVM